MSSRSMTYLNLFIKKKTIDLLDINLYFMSNETLNFQLCQLDSKYSIKHEIEHSQIYFGTKKSLGM